MVRKKQADPEPLHSNSERRTNENGAGKKRKRGGEANAQTSKKPTLVKANPGRDKKKAKLNKRNIKGKERAYDSGAEEASSGADDKDLEKARA